MPDLAQIGVVEEDDGAIMLKVGQRLVTRDVARLDVGQAGYSAVCYEDGGTVDDVIVYRREGDFLVVVNASNREKDLEHFRENTEDLVVEVADESDDWALLALQGPEAAGLLQDLTETDLSVQEAMRMVLIGGVTSHAPMGRWSNEDFTSSGRTAPSVLLRSVMVPRTSSLRWRISATPSPRPCHASATVTAVAAVVLFLAFVVLLTLAVIVARMAMRKVE